jgi:hypothetical protein
LVECKEPEEPFMLAVFLIGSRFGLLALALVTYFVCRPNRDRFESDDEEEAEGSHKLRWKSEGIAVGDEPVYTDTNPPMMSLCD